MINLFDVKSIHFIGVGGVSMSKLCGFFHAKGYECSGSDQVDSDNIIRLRELGVNVYVGENIELARAADIVVYSAAIPPSNSERMVAKVAIERKELLAVMESMFDTSVCVSGAHGKTTVASMIAWLYKVANIDFVAHIGGEVDGIDSLNISKTAKAVIIEACEYSRSFLLLRPKIGVILNIDYDHPDCYADIEDTYRAFATFARQTRDTLIIEYDYRDKVLDIAKNIDQNTLDIAANRERILPNSAQNMRGEKENSTENIYDKKQNTAELVQDMDSLCVLTFGENIRADYSYNNAVKVKGGYLFEVFKRGKCYGEYFIKSLNKINILGALCVIAVGDSVGISQDIVKRSLATFQGVRRRLEYLGATRGGAEVYTDYAHHPKELASLISCIRENFGEQAIFVFEPHTYSRTKALFDDFVAELSLCGELYLLPTYAARETLEQGVESDILAHAIAQKGGNVRYVANIQELVKLLSRNISGKAIFLVGAGIKYREIYLKLAD